MNLLDLSVAWSTVHVLVLFIFMYESRYDSKKTVRLTFLAMVPLCLFNVWLFMTKGPAQAGQLLLLTCTLPSLAFFMAMAKHRDSRFFFTFCLADTISYEILVITRMLGHFLPGDEYFIIFITRLIAFPLLEWLAWKYLRRTYLELQRTVKKGWMGFAVIAALFYVLLVYMTTFPTIIVERPNDIPSVILVLLLMPLIYWSILRVLQHQQRLFLNEQERALLHVQSVQMEQQMRQISLADEQMRIERHDRRHHIQTMAELLASGEIEGAKDLLSNELHTLENRTAARYPLYAADPILNATLSAYFQKAKEAGIDLQHSLSIPSQMTVEPAELSVVFANALENAIEACKELPQSERWIKCTFLTRPSPMFEISNSCKGPVLLDEDGRPVALREGHGFGTRSIISFCEKNEAFITYETTEDTFCLRILLA